MKKITSVGEKETISTDAKAEVWFHLRRNQYVRVLRTLLDECHLTLFFTTAKSEARNFSKQDDALAVCQVVTAKHSTVPTSKHATEHDPEPADSSHIIAIYFPRTFLILSSVYFLSVHMIGIQEVTGLSSPCLSFPIRKLSVHLSTVSWNSIT